MRCALETHERLMKKWVLFFIFESACVFIIYICLNMLKKGKWISLMNDIIRHTGNFSSWVTALSHSFACLLAPWYILLYILLSNANKSIWPRIFLEFVSFLLIIIHKSYFWHKLLTLKWHLSIFSLAFTCVTC